MVYVSLLNGKVIRLLLSVIVFLMFYPVVGHSEVFNVTNEEELREALSIAESNGEDDVINIEAGLYRTFGETFTFDTNEDFSLAIEGEGAGITILDGDGLSRVMTIKSSKEHFQLSVTMRGLTIQNGFHVSIPGDISNPNGAGISVVSQNLTIEDCEFIDNSVVRAGHGGGLYASARNINLSGNLFSGNSTDSSGGGAYLSASELNISENQFYSNSAFGDGGGAYLDSDSGFVSASITNNIFSSNVSSANGGGMAILAGFLRIDYVITNNTFTLNTANENGGGMSFEATLGEVAPPPIEQKFILDIYNNIVFNNSSTENGDDLFIVENGFPGKNLAVSLFNNDYSDLSVDCVSKFGCTTDINEGNNIDEDPKFVDAEAENFSLLADSPCIDAGDPNAPDLPDTDIFGNLRVPPDMGAVEFIEEAIKSGGGCTLASAGASNSIPLYLFIPVLILIRRFVKKYRS